MDPAIGLCATRNGDRVVLVHGDRVYLHDALVRQRAAGGGKPPAAGQATTLAGFIEEGQRALDRAAEDVDWAVASGLGAGIPGDPIFFPLSEAQERVTVGAAVRPRAPVTAANQVFCLGDIFLSHLMVGGNPVPDRVGIFYKQTQDVVGPWEPIVLPRPHRDGVMVGGTEMALVVGRTGRYIPADRAWDHIWGFSVLNDVTLRGLHPQLGPTLKVFETSAPIGPFLVPKARVASPSAVGLRMRINGRQVQDGNTRDMRFDLAECIAEISNWHTLRPGDIIATGDIGSRDALHPGDTVECEVEGVGVLANPIVLG